MIMRNGFLNYNLYNQVSILISAMTKDECSLLLNIVDQWGEVVAAFEAEDVYHEDV